MKKYLMNRIVALEKELAKLKLERANMIHDNINLLVYVQELKRKQNEQISIVNPTFVLQIKNEKK